MKYPKNIKNRVVMIEVNKLCNLFRLEKLGVERTVDNAYIYKASLYSDEQTLNVTWISAVERKDLSYGVLVRGVWLTRRVFDQGTNIIQTVKRIKNIGENENLAKTVMKNWIYDGFAYSFVFEHIEQLPNAYKRLVTDILSDHFVLYHFLRSPVSLVGELNQLGTIFQKTAELLGFLERNIHAHKLNAPREILLTAAILLGIGHYNQFEHKSKKLSYQPHELTQVHDPKIVAIGLIHKAAERNRKIDLEVINRVIAVIDYLEFDF